MVRLRRRARPHPDPDLSEDDPARLPDAAPSPARGSRVVEPFAEDQNRRGRHRRHVSGRHAAAARTSRPSTTRRTSHRESLRIPARRYPPAGQRPPVPAAHDTDSEQACLAGEHCQTRAMTSTAAAWTYGGSVDARSAAASANIRAPAQYPDRRVTGDEQQRRTRAPSREAAAANELNRRDQDGRHHGGQHQQPVHCRTGRHSGRFMA